MEYSVDHIQTERLNLRRLELTDDGAIYDIFSNGDVTRYWSSPQMTELTEAETFIRQTHKGFTDGSLLQWGVIKNDTDKLIGTCAFAGWDKTHRHVEIGFALHRKYWGNGYMKEVLGEFIPFGFKALSFPFIA